ncbi:MAG: enoyl-CoA hydratase/isomerase family protein [Acidimicrobiales bacterium]
MPAEEPGTVAVERDGAVVTVRLSRPTHANSLTTAAKQSLLEALGAAAGDQATRAVVLTGSGKSFCVGQDLVEHAEAMEAAPGHAFDTVGRHYSPIVRLLATMPKPTIAAVNGTCAGAGLGFALACDIRVAARGARFVPAFAAVGLTADSGLSATLARAIGWSRAMGLLMLGRSLTADEAFQVGLVHQVVAEEEMEAEVRDLVSRLASGPTKAYAAIKEALWAAASTDLEGALRREGELQHRLASTADHREAVRAFLDKREPTFRGE